jgi:flagellar motor switch protein FliN/FliY
MTALEEISAFADVPVDLEVELDRTVMTLAQVLELDVDSVIRMTRSAGENIDIRIGGRTVGYGEIVIIEEAVGVRITDFNHEE